MTDETAAPPRRKPPILAIVLGIAVLVLLKTCPFSTAFPFISAVVLFFLSAAAALTP